MTVIGILSIVSILPIPPKVRSGSDILASFTRLTIPFCIAPCKLHVLVQDVKTGKRDKTLICSALIQKSSAAFAEKFFLGCH